MADQRPQRSTSLVIPLQRHKVRTVRDWLRSILGTHDVPQECVDDIVLCTQEACNNAIMHSEAPDGTLEVEARVLDNTVEIEVRDNGHGFDVARYECIPSPEPMANSGRGLYLIKCLMDAVEVRCDDRGGTVVCMMKATSTA